MSRPPRIFYHLLVSPRITRICSNQQLILRNRSYGRLPGLKLLSLRARNRRWSGPTTGQSMLGCADFHYHTVRFCLQLPSILRLCSKRRKFLQQSPREAKYPLQTIWKCHLPIYKWLVPPEILWTRWLILIS